MKNIRFHSLKRPVSFFIFIGFALLSYFSSTSQAQSCVKTVTANKAPISGAAENTFDNNLSTFFQSSYDDWQYIEIDFGCPGGVGGQRPA